MDRDWDESFWDQNSNLLLKFSNIYKLEYI